jgi:hypothetical protein
LGCHGSASRAGRFSPIENRGDCAQETCAITPDCALAAGRAADTNSSSSPETNQATQGAGAKPGVSGLDPDAGMRGLFESEQWGNRDRSCPHERSECEGNRSEDHGLLGHPVVHRSSQGSARFLSSTRRAAVCAGS